MIEGNFAGRLWYRFIFIAYVFVYSVGVQLVSIIFNKTGFSTIPYLRGMFIGIIVFSVCVFFGPVLLQYRNQELHRRDYTVLLATGGVILYSLCIGLINKNSLVYIVSDSVYLFIGLAIFLFLRMGNARIRIHSGNIGKLAVLLGLTLLVVRYGLFYTSLMPTILFLLSAVFAYSLQAGHYKAAGLSIVPLALIVSQLNRTSTLTVLFLVAVVMFVLFAQRNYSRFLKMAISAAVLVSIVGLAIISLINFSDADFTKTPLGRRIVTTMAIVNGGDIDTTKDVAVQQRFYEAQMVMDSLGHNPVYWLLGKGMGGTVDMSASQDASVQTSALLGEEDVHNIHILPVAIVFRFGLVGLFFVIAVCWYLFAKARKSREPGVVIFSLSGLAVIFYSLSASSVMITEPLLWVSLAMISNEKEQ